MPMSGLTAFQHWLQKIVAAQRPEKVGDRELADLGMTHSDMQLLLSGTPGSASRIAAMAAEMGLSHDMLAEHPEFALELTQHCGHCSAAKTCRKALETGQPLPQDRCPNAPIYRALTEMAGKP